MKSVKGAILVIACGSLLALSLVSCTTVNRLDMYTVENATLAADMRVPPEPKLASNYWVSFHRHDPFGTFLSIGTNLIKANEATRAETRMREALEYVDVPSLVLRESHASCASALDARRVDRRQKADFLLNLEIHEYGIKADSPGSAVSLHMHLTASILHQKSGELVWRREITLDDPASPTKFGLGQIVGNIVTAGVLADLSSQSLEDGFQRLAQETARSVARMLQNDLYSARYDL